MKNNFKINKANNTVKAEINLLIYSKDAILGTAYLFLDKIYVFIEQKDQDAWFVNLKLKKNIKETSEEIIGEFYNELLNQALRSEISKQNSGFRKYIVESALFSAVYGQRPEEENFLDLGDDVDLEDANYKDDPLGIAVPWENK
ncbi:His-Xaa-Ser system protein HxsD [Candidatus Parcubacteria bacterium]|nr:His-Xaa-Ser system protein HxsD [Candidatus Parcubacteria bacterium]